MVGPINPHFNVNAIKGVGDEPSKQQIQNDLLAWQKELKDCQDHPKSTVYAETFCKGSDRIFLHDMYYIEKYSPALSEKLKDVLDTHINSGEALFDAIYDKHYDSLATSFQEKPELYEDLSQTLTDIYNDLGQQFLERSLLLSKIKVIGPSLTKETSILAPKMPVLTSTFF